MPWHYRPRTAIDPNVGREVSPGVFEFPDGMLTDGKGNFWSKRFAKEMAAALVADRSPVVEDQHKKIKGYRDLTQDEIAMMNQAKSAAEQVGELLDEMAKVPDIDERWLQLGCDDLQTGFMKVIRAIARPETF